MALSTLKPLLTRWPFLRLLAVTLSIISIVMLASLLPVINGNGIFYADGLEELFNCFPWAGNCFTVFYSGISLIAFSAEKIKNGKERPCHPGVDIAFDFIGWGLNWSMGIILLTWVDYSNPDFYCERDRYYDEWDCGQARAVTGVQITACVLTLTVG